MRGALLADGMIASLDGDLMHHLVPCLALADMMFDIEGFLHHVR